MWVEPRVERSERRVVEMEINRSERSIVVVVSAVLGLIAQLLRWSDVE